MPRCLGTHVTAKSFVQENHLAIWGAGGIEYGPAPMRVGAGPCKPFLRDGKARLCLLVEARLRLCRVNILPLPDMVCDSSTRQAA